MFSERVPLTIRHRYDFSTVRADIDAGELDAASWDALRGSDSPFGFVASDTAAAEATIRPRAERILEIIDSIDAKRVVSYGVGTGLLERQLHAAGVDITCTEYAAGTRERLAEFLPSVVAHDLRDGPLTGFDLHLLHRVDTELSDAEWRRYFHAATEPHLVVVSGFVALDTLRAELLRWRQGATKAGWLRTDRRFRQLLPGAERTMVADLPAFLTRHR